VRSMTIPRAEYPRPQFVRSDWLCLNGEWEFEIDNGDSGLERGLLQRELAERILVPFCPESSLSGIHHLDFMRAVWYRRHVTIPKKWAGQRLLLHFQAADYDTTVWVNGREVRRHRGGFTPFTCDLGLLTDAPAELTLVVRVRDNPCGPQPRGKQSQRFHDWGCFYTRTTGIWQTVWLEPVPLVALRRPRITPDLANGLLRLEQPISNNTPGMRLRAQLADEYGPLPPVETAADLDLAPRLDLPIPAERRRLWSPQTPHLYDLEISLLDASGQVLDTAKSYAGLRSISIDGQAIKLNGQPVFQRLVLDQGYYPTGVLTAPSDEDLQQDIRRSMAAGFNGARLHQKIFEERFLYHADRLGYLVWGEFPDWGSADERVSWQDDATFSATFITQWLEELERDYSHPAIVGWCGLNESYYKLRESITNLDDVTRGMFLAAKAMDTSRPVLDASGYAHRVPETDVYDAHDYLTGSDFWQDFQDFRVRHARLVKGEAFTNRYADNQIMSLPYQGQPYFVSEFGGLWWKANATPGSQTESWGYGQAPVSEEEFYKRFQALCDTLLDNPAMFGYCYTQLTDVSVEQNGIFTFERKAKFDLARLHTIQSRPAAIERKTDDNPLKTSRDTLIERE
jgi:beta-galactosidase/beta-glucuronidase